MGYMETNLSTCDRGEVELMLTSKKMYQNSLEWIAFQICSWATIEIRVNYVMHIL